MTKAVIVLLLAGPLVGCAARGRALWPGWSCPEEAVPLTPPTFQVVVLPAVIITGRASVVVCENDRSRITDDVRAALHRELAAIVREQHFHMVTVCSGETRSASEAAVATEKRKAMIDRLDRVVGARLIRRVDCAFGWIEGL